MSAVLAAGPVLAAVSSPFDFSALVSSFWALTVDGLTYGSIYALVAVGYTLVYGVLRLINFAHSEIFMLGMFGSYVTLWLLGFAPIPVKVTWVDRGHSWSWKVGPVEMDHVVEPRDNGGCRVALVFRGPSAFLERVAAVLYGTPAQLLLRNMGRVG